MRLLTPRERWLVEVFVVMALGWALVAHPLSARAHAGARVEAVER